MSIFYSAAVRGFFHSELGHVPDDAVEIAADTYQALQDGQSRGLRIVPDADGQPVLAPQPAPPLADQVRGLVTRRLGDAARAAGYDSIASAASYADEPAVRRYQREGQALRAWRSLMWDTAFDWLQQHPAGDLAELQTLLPPAPDLNALG